VLRGLVAETSRTAIVDLEAGLEHLSRGTARHVDTLLVVGEPYFKSLEAAQRSFTLARDLGIAHIPWSRTRSARRATRTRCASSRRVHAMDIAASCRTTRTEAG
jgi:CO dehydrogenase maturation factor